MVLPGGGKPTDVLHRRILPHLEQRPRHGLEVALKPLRTRPHMRLHVRQHLVDLLLQQTKRGLYHFAGPVREEAKLRLPY